MERLDDAGAFGVTASRDATYRRTGPGIDPIAGQGSPNRLFAAAKVDRQRLPLCGSQRPQSSSSTFQPLHPALRLAS